MVRSSQDFYVSLRGDGPPPVRLRQGVGLLRPVLQVSKGMLRLEGRKGGGGGGICFWSGQKDVSCYFSPLLALPVLLCREDCWYEGNTDSVSAKC